MNLISIECIKIFLESDECEECIKSLKKPFLIVNISVSNAVEAFHYFKRCISYMCVQRIMGIECVISVTTIVTVMGSMVSVVSANIYTFLSYLEKILEWVKL